MDVTNDWRSAGLGPLNILRISTDLVVAQEGATISVWFLLSEAQMRWIKSFFPLSHGTPRVDDRGVISGNVFVIKN